MTKPPPWFKPYAPRMTWIEFNQNIQIDLINRYVYFEVAKAACSTVKKRLQPIVARGLPETKNIHPSVFESPFVKPFQMPNGMMRRALQGDGFFRFTFVREPTARFVSGYLDKIARVTPQKERFVKRYYPNLDPSDEVTMEMFLSALEGEKSFKIYDKHWRPQVELLFQPEQGLDFIGTVEQFEQGWSQLGEHIPCVKTSSKENIVWHATSADTKVDDTLSADQKRRVETLMAADYAFHAKVSEAS